MLRPRIIPVLLLKDKVLVKSKEFMDHQYIGDPFNAVRIFNELMADEIILLDISATAEKRTIDTEFIRSVSEETNMPFAVGGGIKTIRQIKTAISAGAEKVVIGSQAALHPEFIKEASETFGSSTIMVCIDVKKNKEGLDKVWVKNGKFPTGLDPVEFTQQVTALGAGEIIIQSMMLDGSMTGYDIDLTRKIALATTIPVIALGGAGNYEHFSEAFETGMASAVAGGSIFVFQGQRKGVLIHYPENKKSIFDRL